MKISAAQKFCRNHDAGSLLEIESPEEEQFIKVITNEFMNGYTGASKSFFIGNN